MTDAKPKIRPRRAGTIQRYSPPKEDETEGHYVVRCTAPDGSRPVFHLKEGPESPEARAAALVEAEEITVILWRDGLGASSPRDRSKRLTSSGEDCSTWFQRWLDERKRRGFTATRENDSHFREHITPAIGPLHIRDWTADDLRALCRSLDQKVQAGALSWKTAANIWGTATKMCKDASSSKLDVLRVRADNPALGVEGPDRGARTAKQYLYPSEFLKFITCAEVPLKWRRAVAVAIYIFPRAGELRVLRWDDIDLEHGTVHIHRACDRNTGHEKATKTDMARRFSIEPALLPLLTKMRATSQGSGLVLRLPSDRDLARGFRRWLARAGVDRHELHHSSPTRKAMTFHDLRATGLTWLAVRGDDPLKIMQRAGHTDFATTKGYIREAEAVREGFGSVFPTVPKLTFKRPQNERALAPNPALLSQELSQTTQVLETRARRTGLEAVKPRQCSGKQAR